MSESPGMNSIEERSDATVLCTVGPSNSGRVGGTEEVGLQTFIRSDLVIRVCPGWESQATVRTSLERSRTGGELGSSQRWKC